MKRACLGEARLVFAAIAACVSCAAANAATQVFTSEAAFLGAASGATTLDFDSTPSGPIAGNAFAAQGFTFQSLAGSGLSIANTFGDNHYLNIGEEPGFCCDGNNDSLQVSVQGNWAAAAFALFDGVIPSGAESVTFYGDTDNVLYARQPADGAVSFLGVIADEPIRRIVVVEAANDSDDVGYDNFHLGNALAAVPEPETYALLMSGFALLGFAARRKARR